MNAECCVDVDGWDRANLPSRHFATLSLAGQTRSVMISSGCLSVTASILISTDCLSVEIIPLLVRSQPDGFVTDFNKLPVLKELPYEINPTTRTGKKCQTIFEDLYLSRNRYIIKLIPLRHHNLLTPIDSP